MLDVQLISDFSILCDAQKFIITINLNDHNSNKTNVFGLIMCASLKMIHILQVWPGLCKPMRSTVVLVMQTTKISDSQKICILINRLQKEQKDFKMGWRWRKDRNWKLKNLIILTAFVKLYDITFIFFFILLKRFSFSWSYSILNSNYLNFTVQLYFKHKPIKKKTLIYQWG